MKTTKIEPFPFSWEQLNEVYTTTGSLECIFDPTTFISAKPVDLNSVLPVVSFVHLPSDEKFSKIQKFFSSGLSAEIIFLAIKKELGINKESLQSKTRKPEVVRARQIFCFFYSLCNPSLSLKNIGMPIFKDHATVLNQKRLHMKHMTTRSAYVQKINKITEFLYLEGKKNKKVRKKLVPLE